MQGGLSFILLCALAILLLVAAFGDLRSRTIPNWLNGAIALLAVPFWFATDLAIWPDLAVQIGVATLVFAIFALLFNLGMMGGGDVKMLTALALWLPWGAVLKLLVIMSIAGGILTLAMLIISRIKKTQEKLEVPYGVAISFGGLWILAEPFLNHFGS